MAALSYRASATLTITLASLANGSIATSSAIDNSANNDSDFRFQFKIKSGASGTTTSGYVNIYFIGSSDGGTTYDDNNKTRLFSIPIIANATTYIMSDTLQRYGITPSKFFKISVENKTGGALDATAGSHVVTYEAIQ